MGNIAHTKTKKDGKTIIKCEKNDELDAQAAMKNDPKYILGKTRVNHIKRVILQILTTGSDCYCKKEKKKMIWLQENKKEDWRSELGYVKRQRKSKETEHQERSKVLIGGERYKNEMKKQVASESQKI
ncbi:MAG: hypothetical protein CM15mV20_0970 [uncultured marine virus]|nr:MAG: hypothetical protein CM15mV20_0970 [uncultured marine virus]